MKLSHVLLVSGLAGTLATGFVVITGMHGRAMVWLVAPVAAILAVLLAGPIARLFRLSPLMILAGPCPRCGMRPAGWWYDDRRTGALHLQCGNCGQPVDLWAWRRPAAGEIAPDTPSFVLRWPTFLGFWRRVDPR